MSWKKEIVDQPAHALWSGVSAVAPFLAWSLPMPLWARVVLSVAALASLVGICVREWAQKRDKPGGILANWPGLDSIGYGAGLVLGIVAGVIVVVKVG